MVGTEGGGFHSSILGIKDPMGAEDQSRSVAGIRTGLLLVKKGWGRESGTVRALMGMDVCWVQGTTRWNSMTACVEEGSWREVPPPSLDTQV